MKKNIKVVIGGVFGDEGKGLFTDYFCSQFTKDKEVLNVRFNGSSQAGHTVTTPDGKRHIFSHFGAGSFNDNVITYLSSYFIVNPISFMSEYERLVEQQVFPKVYLCKDSSLIIPFDSLINIFLETSRGNDRHGSCGIGVFEAVVRARQEDLNIKVSDLQQSKDKLFERLKKIRDTYYTERINEIGENNVNEKDKALFYNDNLIWNYIEDAKDMLRVVQIVDDSVLNTYEYQVYEGAQGLLLDWGNRGYMPNLTASYTGLKNVVPLLNGINDIENSNIEVCYLTRSYFTRHGAGKFITEVENKDVLGYNIYDKTNIPNTWQGHLRFGYLDKELFVENVLKDLGYLVELNNKPMVSIGVTHLDQTDNKVLLGKDKEQHIDTFIKKFTEITIDNFYITTGETRNDCKIIQK